ncbi:MAG: 30S ribosomal protein S17 [Planctomycetes bacterium]|nr:30S ribosomal protein S17 [Planctomycetota bacterium]
MTPNISAPAGRSARKTVVGRVVSDKMDKTIVVQVERLVQEPRVGKYVRRFSKCYAHDEKEEAGPGDRVELMETRPLSKQKRWRLVRVVAKSPEAKA